MLQQKWQRIARMAVCGAFLLQAAGCNFQAFNEAIQTIFLGVTAAGAVAILQNI
ncbi:MAG: hypothetical protein AABZ47_14395 [Planctomycetota bacterium]